MQNRSRFAGVIVLLFGSMALFSSLGKPRIESLHGSDILGLIGAGMCFGVGLVGLFGKLKLGQ